MNRILAPALAALAVGLACSRTSAPSNGADAAAPAAPTPDAGETPTATPAPTATPPSAATPEPVAPAAAAPDAGPADAGAAPAEAAPSAAVPTPTPTPTAPPAPTPITAAVARVGAQDQPLQRDAVTVVDPAASFELAVPVHLADGRLALHDETDAMVASTGTTELSDDSTRYRLVPNEPLRPGSRYTLRLDGAVTREPHGSDGRAHAPVVLQLKTSGERPPAPARKKHGARR